MSNSIQFIDFNTLINFVESSNTSMSNRQITRKSNTIADNTKTLFNSNVDIINRLLQEYVSALMNDKNTTDLYNQYVKENNNLNNKLKNSSYDTLTNNRRTYYKDQQNTALDTYYFYLIVIYIIVFLSFISYILIYSSLSRSIQAALVVAFIILPFISTYILGFFMYIINMIYSVLPKTNVQKDKKLI